MEIETLLRLGSVGMAMLYEGVRDQDWRVRESAAAALWHAGSEPDDRAILSWYLVARQEWGRVDSLQGDAVEPLIAVLGHPMSTVRSNASRRLVRIGLPSVRALSSVVLDSHSERQVASAITALDQIANAERLRGKPDPVPPKVREAISRRRIEQLAALDQILGS